MTVRDLVRRLLPARFRKAAGEPGPRSADDRQKVPARTRELAAASGSLWCAIAYNEYGSYCVPLSARHRPAVRRVLEHAVYEPDTIAFLRARCGDGDIVHAGMFFGDFLPAICGATAPGATVWAFEPGAENFRCARITAILNGLDDLQMFHAGLGDEPRGAVLRVVDEQGTPLGGGSRIVSDAADGATTQPVQIVRVDDVVPADRQVSIVQLDVEGFEKEALQGALATIRRCRPILILEDLADSSLIGSEWFAQHIMALGYAHTCDLHGNKVFEAGASPLS